MLAGRIQKVFDEGQASVEAHFVARDGTRTPYYFTGLRTRFDGKRCLLGMGIDITGRRRVEDALKERQALLQLFVEHSPVALAMLDRELKYLTGHLADG